MGTSPDYEVRASDQLVRLARLALIGNRDDVTAFLRREARRLQASDPDTANRLNTLLRANPVATSPLRDAGADQVPVDRDSRLQLVRHEFPVTLDDEPVWSPAMAQTLKDLVAERGVLERLMDSGVEPTRSILLHGPPGYGKTLAARWLARELGAPLLVLDLAAVMSSFLGRTGNNLRSVLDYAKSVPCVLLIDEFDAIAKRRDDSVEVGELKRLVTVLLQEIDTWPSSGVLIAATNHPQLLDPAIWRRFDVVLEFHAPTRELLEQAIWRWLEKLPDVRPLSRALAVVFASSSFSDVRRSLMAVRRSAALSSPRGESAQEAIEKLIRDRVAQLDRRERGDLARLLVESGLSQRSAHELTGVSRDTIRKHRPTTAAPEKNHGR